MRGELSDAPDPLTDANLNYLKPQWKNFSYAELQTATINFCQSLLYEKSVTFFLEFRINLLNVDFYCIYVGYLIGKGGYAEVYRGHLRREQLVALKRLSKGPLEERIGDLLSEIGIMAHVNHPNTAKIIGYGVESGMYLVLELSPLGSLASITIAKRKWSGAFRYKIVLGIAKGLLYLHEGCQRRIIHRDIKAANILITEDFEPQNDGLTSLFQNSKALLGFENVKSCQVGRSIINSSLVLINMASVEARVVLTSEQGRVWKRKHYYPPPHSFSISWIK